MTKLLQQALNARFQDAPPVPDLDVPAWHSMAARSSCRRFADKPVPAELVDLLCSLALSSPSKSDLQQRDLVIVDDPSLRAAITERIPGGHWVAKAPVFIIICGNNRRHRQLMGWRDMPFTNDHLDAFFNAAVDGAIALSALLLAAEAAGLGGCPISVIRNEAALVSKLIGLPAHVFPVAGIALGWPDGDRVISKRLPLAATVHRNRFDDSNVQQQIADYDGWRAASHPFASQRDPARFGQAATYGWSEDKARQYADPDRADFGAFIRAQGFGLD